MKKTLITLLALVFVLGIAGTAFAASANPFVDVPAKHWAYDAVAKLAKAGVVDGYGDGTFRGDRTMTRYEMAQVVAKAMARSDKADAETKALIDKLAVEFASELNNLGVRLSKVEAKTNIWFTSETRFMYSGDSPTFPAAMVIGSANNPAQSKLSGPNSLQWRERLYVKGDVNDTTSFTARIYAQGQVGETGTTNASSVSGNVDANNDLKADRMFFTTTNTLGMDKVIWGRQPLAYGTTAFNWKTGNNDGVTLVKKLGDMTAQAGLLDIKDDFATPAAYNLLSTPKAYEYSYLNLAFPLDQQGGVFNVSYFDSGVNGSYKAANGFANDAAYVRSTGIDAGVSLPFGEWTVNGDYQTSNLKKVTGDMPAGTSPKAYAFMLTNAKTNKNLMFGAPLFRVDASKPGSDMWLFGYKSIQAGAVASGIGSFTSTATGWNGTRIGSATALSGFGSVPTDNTKSWVVQYENVLAKNIVLDLQYQDVKFKDSGNDLDKVFTTMIQLAF